MRSNGPALGAGRPDQGFAGADAARLSSRFGDAVGGLAVTPHVDERGRLVELDFSALPFAVRRVFAVTDVPPGTDRGSHRHRRGTQALFCLAGRVEVELRLGDARDEIVLTPSTGGLRIAAGVWARQRYVIEGSTLLVLASEPFDQSSYDTSFR